MATKKRRGKAAKIADLTVLPVQLLDSVSSITTTLINQLPERPPSTPERDLLDTARAFLKALATRRRLGELVVVPEEMLVDVTAANADALLQLLRGGGTSSTQSGSTSGSSGSSSGSSSGGGQVLDG